MNEAFLISNLLKLRIKFYRVGVVERLQRFRLLIFFILATVIPTFGLLKAIILVASKNIMIIHEANQYNLHISIFQLLALIWMGSQFDILMKPDFESYLNSLKIKWFSRVVIESIFGLFVAIPFGVFLLSGLYNSLVEHYDPLYISRFIYLLYSLSFISMCVVFKRINTVWLLLITNTIVSFSNMVEIDILCGVAPFFICFRIFSHKKFFQQFIETATDKIKTDIFYGFPNLKLYIKSLIVHDKIYTGCIFGISILLIMIYIACIQQDMNPEISFLIASCFIMYFMSLLSYKLDESRKNHGAYFSNYYSKIKLYLIDIMVLIIMASISCAFLTVLAVYFKVDLIQISKTILISILVLMSCVAINKKLVFSGPVFSLVATAGILLIF